MYPNFACGMWQNHQNSPHHLFASGYFIDAVKKETTDDVDDDANYFVLFHNVFFFGGGGGRLDAMEKSLPQQNIYVW